MPWELDENGFYRQPTTGELRARSATSKRRLGKDMQPFSSVTMPEGSQARIVSTWWSDAWCSNLASYADMKNRLARGRKYLRADTVIDLQVRVGSITGLVQGSADRPYQVEIGVRPLDGARKREIELYCAGRMTGLETLVAGAPPQELADLFTGKTTGLFPDEQDLDPHCTCPDMARVCKHTFAVLYGVGSRLDDNPFLLFQLRGIEVSELVSKSVDERVSSLRQRANSRSSQTLDDDDISDIFGL